MALNNAKSVVKEEIITKSSKLDGGLSAAEVAALISAAIAASEGDAKINFRIRSIKKIG